MQYSIFILTYYLERDTIYTDEGTARETASPERLTRAAQLQLSTNTQGKA